jgi:hypothetical protein
MRLHIVIFTFLLFLLPILSHGQEKQKKDELKMERNISGSRFKVYNNFVNFGSGLGRQISDPLLLNPFEIGWNFHVKRNYFKFGYLRSNFMGMFGYSYPQVMNDLHAGLGFRRETKAINLAFYGCVSRAFGLINPTTSFAGWGGYIEAQFTRKIFFDIGIGPTLFFAYNKDFPMAGLRIDFFMSGSYKGRINQD